MAYSWQEETYAAGTVSISVDIEYLDKSYIHLYLDGVETTDFTWASSTVLTLGAALSASTVVLITRQTAKEDLYIVFADGAAFIRENLDTQNTQFLHLAQELVEGRSIDGFYGDLSMNGYRITNLGAPVADNDAVRKVYVDTLVGDETSARQAADASLQSQITAATPVLANEMSVVTWHGQTITNSVDVPDGVNAFSIGPQITIAPGQSVNLGAGSYWNILGNVFESDELYNITANNITTEDGNTTVAVDEIVVDSDLGTMAAQNANSVSISGGSISGITDLAVADGGTGASTAAAARNNLGAAASGANTDITSITGSAASLTTARTFQTNLASTTATSFNGTANNTHGVTGILPIANGGTNASDAATARTNLGLGTMATQAASAVAITGGTVTGITDLAVADGGTGASTAAAARTNLGVGYTSSNTSTQQVYYFDNNMMLIHTIVTPSAVAANSSASHTWTYPFTFAFSPYVNVRAVSSNSATFLATFEASNTASAAGFLVNNSGSSVTPTLHYFAYGQKA